MSTPTGGTAVCAPVPPAAAHHRVRTATLLWALLAVGAVLLGFAPSADAQRAFGKRFSANDTGDIRYVGNTLSTCNTPVGNPAPPTCAQAQAGANASNNSYLNQAINVAGLPGPNANSSSARFDLPDGAQVLWAGLYWTADGGSTTGTPANRPIQLRAPGETSFRALTPSQLDTGAIANRPNSYQGFVEVTDVVRAAGGGTYTAGGIAMTTDVSDRWAGWSLVIVVKDATQPPRNLSVFDGFVGVSGTQSATINVAGFTTPPSGPVRTRVGVIAAEGDRGIVGDRATLNGRLLTNAAKPETNYFNSSLTTLGVRRAGLDPSYDNTLGYDADIVAADGYLANGATSASIGLATNGDAYAPGVVTLATELYAPRLTPSKSVENLSRTTGPARRGDRLRYTVAYRNEAGAGGDAAAGFRIEDRVPVGTTYVGGSMRVTGGAGSPASPTDQAGDDGGEITDGGRLVRIRTGTGASATQGGTLPVGQRAEVTFDVTVDDVPDDTQIDNVATASFRSDATGTPFSDLPTPVASVRVREPDLAIAKTHQGAIIAGLPVRFALSATNVGGASTSGTVTVRDSLDAASFQRVDGADGAGWDCQVAGRDVTCTRDDALGPGEGYPPIYIDATASAALPATVQNVARIDGGGDVDPSNNTGTDVGAGTNRADLRAEKAFDPTSAIAGDVVEWTMRVVNDGPSPALAARLSDPVPAGLTVRDVTTTRGTCTQAVTCALGDLPAGEAAVVTVRAQVTGAPRTITNTVTAATDTTDPNPSNDQASAQLEVRPSADLAVTKVAPVGPAPDANAPYTWAITVRNAGPDAAQEVEVIDGLPDNFENASATATGGAACEVAAGRMRCTLGSLAPGDSFTISLTGSSPQGGLVSNAAAARSATIDPNPGNNQGSDAVVVTPAADVSVAKAFLTTTGAQLNTALDPGNSALVRLTVGNAGPSTATGVVATDVLPAGLDLAADQSGTAGPCSSGGAGNRTIECAIGTLAPNTTVVRTFRVTVAAGAAGQIGNTATVDATQEDPFPGNDSNLAPLAITPGADLSLAKTASRATASVGDTITWTLRAANAGPDTAQQVVILDELPEGVTGLQTTSPGCTITGRTLRCEIASLASGAANAVEVAVSGTVDRLAAGTSLGNVATVSSSTAERNPGNEKGTSSTSIGRRVELSTEKTARETSIGPDQAVTYDLTVRNAGPNGARDVVLVDTLPAGVDLVASDPGCAVQAGAVRCAVGTLLAGEQATRSVTVRSTRAQAGTTVTNGLTATSTDPGPAPGRSTRDVAVRPQVDLGLTKTATPARITAGGEAVFTLDVTNRGPSPATGVTLEDVLPAGLEAVQALPTQGTCDTSGPVRCALGTIQDGGAAQVLLRVRGTTAGTLVNRAAVSANEDEATPRDGSAEAPLVIDPAATPAEPGPGSVPPPGGTAPGAPRLTVDKRRLTARPVVGQPISYRITVRNTGDATARGVVVTDTPSREAAVLGLGSSRGPCASRSPIRCAVGDLAPGASAEVQVRLSVASAGDLRNAATAVGAGGGVAAVAGDRDTAAVRSAPNTIALGITPDRRVVRGGDRVRFTLRVPNRSGATLRDVRVCATLPRGFTYARRGPLRINGRRACVTLPRLAGRATRTLTFDGRATRRERAATLRPSATAKASGRLTARDATAVRVLPGPAVASDGGVTG